MSTNESTIVGAHLVGSVTTTSAAETFTVASTHLGSHLRRIPDGEVGKRFHWILFQGEVFDNTPGLTRIGDEPAIMAGFDLRPFTLDGSIAAEEVVFPELGYAQAAREAYAEFVRLRDEGIISAGTKFQVSLPTPLAPITTFVNAEDRPGLEGPYTEALTREIESIAADIPHQDLAIQFDLAIEFAYLETAAGRDVEIATHAWFDPVIDGLVDRAVGIINVVSPTIEVGVHLCYGDVGEKHFVEPLDTANLTRVANAIAERVARPLTWLHLPVPIERDDVDYFRPLGELTPAYAELYLGLVHHQDGIEGGRRRIEAAISAGVKNFGVGTECGFGRGPAERTVPLLELHAGLANPLPTHS